ncbi:ORF 2 [Bemisia-associated dicistrovirus 1]|nr:ORF 2 [Bemisia-associated dicistrovirus 1]
MENAKPSRIPVPISRANQGSEAGKSDTSHTRDNADADRIDENGKANHVSVDGKSGGTLLGPAESKKYNDSTGFISEGKVETKKMDKPKEEVKLAKSLHPNVEQAHSIERIMSRPVKIATITFSTQSAVGQLLGSYDVINTIRTNSRFRLLREKLSSFYGVNMTAHLKITLNAQPMESGLFQIFFIPYYRTEGSVIAPTQFQSNFESLLPYTTGCPNIPCNISKQSEVELAIPYTGPVSFINLTNINADFGQFFVQSIVPITDSTNNASCEMSVYMYFTDVKLFGTTANNVIAVPQGLEDIKPSECEEDHMKKHQGPISKIGNSLLPVLDSLGLSAPDANPNTERMSINPFGSPATVDTTAVAMKVSYTFKHHLNIGDLGVNTQADEMDLDVIAYKPCYYNQFAWPSTSDADTRLASYPVEPNCVIKNEANVTAPTRLRFVANSFRYWRGTIRFLFMVVGNQYHSGRLRFVYSLGGGLPAEFADNFPRTFSQIVDIRKGTHFVVECPYFASTPWRLIPQRWDDTNNIYLDTDNGSLDDVPARLEVFVENELRNTQTTSSSVNIVCFQGAGADFEFAVPIAPRSRPYINPAVPDGDLATPQGLDFLPLNMATGLSNTQPMHASPHKYTVGEKITSVRQLIKRYQLIGYGDAVRGLVYILYPFAMIRPEGAPTLAFDMLSVFSTLYQFRRGSIRFMVVPVEPGSDFLLRYDPEVGVADAPTIDVANPFGVRCPIRTVTAFPSGLSIEEQNLVATVPFRSHLSGGMEVEFPYYSRFHKLKTSIQAGDSLNGSYLGQIREGRVPAGIAFFELRNVEDPDASNDSVRTDIYRSAADDFTLGYLLGAPFCFYINSL